MTGIAVEPRYAEVVEGSTLSFTVSGRGDNAADYQVVLRVEGVKILDEWFEGPASFEYSASYTFNTAGGIPVVARLTEYPAGYVWEMLGEITVTAVGPVTQVTGFNVPYSLEAGTDVNVRVRLKNIGDASGYLFVIIDGNPDSPDRYITVETGTTYPASIAPGKSTWLDIYFRYFKMPGWDFNLIATDEDEISQISRTILLSVAIPTTLTITAPDRVAAGEMFAVSGILYESGTGVPIPGQPTNLSYDGRPIGQATTDADGGYILETSISEGGVWTLRADFPGTQGYAASASQMRTAVAAAPAALTLQVVGPLVLGVALAAFMR